MGAKLASNRNATLVSAKAVDKDGVTFYMFEFGNVGGNMHQVLEMCVAKGILWSVDGSAPEERWSKGKIADVLTTCLLSFTPKSGATYDT